VSLLKIDNEYQYQRCTKLKKIISLATYCRNTCWYIDKFICYTFNTI